MTNTPATTLWDTCVIGAGLSGLSAAISAARHGARTLLVEKETFPGGAAITGLHRTLCGLYGTGEDPPAEPDFDSDFLASIDIRWD